MKYKKSFEELRLNIKHQNIDTDKYEMIGYEIKENVNIYCLTIKIPEPNEKSTWVCSHCDYINYKEDVSCNRCQNYRNQAKEEGIPKEEILEWVKSQGWDNPPDEKAKGFNEALEIVKLYIDTAYPLQDLSVPDKEKIVLSDLITRLPDEEIVKVRKFLFEIWRKHHPLDSLDVDDYLDHNEGVIK